MKSLKITDKLSPSERKQRQFCIERVMHSLNSLKAAAEALHELREDRLYRETHRTFEAFCRDTFGLTRRTVNRKIAAAGVLRLLESEKHKNGTSDVPFLPNTEAQVMELAPMASGQQTAAWKSCIERAGGKQPTLRQVRAVVSETLCRAPNAEKLPDQQRREALQRAITFLKSIPSPSENINAALNLLSREIESGAEQNKITENR